MSDEPILDRTDPSRQKGCLRTGRCVLGFALLGLICGAVLGLILLPPIASIFLPRGYEIPPWNGQFVGQVVGLLVGPFFALRKCAQK